MDLISGGAALPGHLRGGIVALGNFDGFHAGHQAVVGAARDWARKLDRPALVASFDPHPARLFQPDVPSFSLSTIEQRGEWLRVAGNAPRRGRRGDGRRFHLRAWAQRQRDRSGTAGPGAWFCRAGGGCSAGRCGHDQLDTHSCPSARCAAGDGGGAAHPAVHHQRRGGTWRQAGAHLGLPDRQHDAGGLCAAGLWRLCCAGRAAIG